MKAILVTRLRAIQPSAPPSFEVDFDNGLRVFVHNGAGNKPGFRWYALRPYLPDACTLQDTVPERERRRMQRAALCAALANKEALSFSVDLDGDVRADDESWGRA